MGSRSVNRMMSFRIPDTALEFVMDYIDDPRDRLSVSLVCRRWSEIDALTRKHITISFCYITTPARLREKFPRLESLKLKGKPRASMFNLIPEDWGGQGGPWIREIAENFICIKCLHFRRMIITDSELEVLATRRGHMLQSLKLDKCSGFSTDGLLHIARNCRSLRTFFLEDSAIEEKDGDWLHELATHNTVLDKLNFYNTNLVNINIADLELLAQNCPFLNSIKVSDSDALELKNFFRSATALEEFAGGSFNKESPEFDTISFPQRLRRLGPGFLGRNEMPIIFPRAALLTKLDLLYALLNTEDHCQLIQLCPNLEALEARNVIGDIGLEVVSRSCRRLKRIRIERGADEEDMEDEQGVVSQRGLSALAQGCNELLYIAIHVSDINNACLEAIGTYCKNLRDFRLVLLEREAHITELPLDNGVRALLMGCEELRRFAFYVRNGALTDVGLGYIGKYSNNIRWMLLGLVGESDEGLIEFSKGCPNLQKLEMRGCCFSERTLAILVTQIKSLRYLWVHQPRAPLRINDLLPMVQPNWNIEIFPYRRFDRVEVDGVETVVEVLAQPDQILAYYSLAGQRRDFPPGSVVPLDLDLD
ncbi:Coronatine-insensitive protein 1 [Ranunculus cassubicifolius]